ncbi:MAG: glutamine--fructose-6-phosphate transaminase (isomerizing) [Planctomycetes bacterium]|nr:glutamine--fructose-6-phosphate transaminase (isomerizing) [Planctomycetota bacterium]
MCGIVGCVTSERNAPYLLVDGLRRLEYRGYDSAGLAVIKDGEIVTLREVGKLNNLESALKASGLGGTIGLGHTRWATHGRPTQVNAHPHRDGSGKIVVVHNGIIENFRELRAELRDQGHVFASETDSEVIAHLIESCYRGDLAQAVLEATRRLEGAYAIGVMHADHPEMLVGARKDGPLVIGLGENENFLASDVTAALEHTSRFVYLDDGQVAELTRDGLRILDASGHEQPYVQTNIAWSLAQAERGGYPHFMLKEIHEQPTVISDTLLGRLDETRGEIVLDDLGIDDEAARAISRIHIIACGTSWHAGHVAKFYIEQLARIPVEVDYASEYRYRDPILDPDGLVVAISQSGETADTIAAMRMARQAGVRVVGVCNVIGSTISREADGSIMTHAGPEIGVASTKAFISQLVALLLLALRLGRARGHLSVDELRRHCLELRQLPQVVENVLKTEGRVLEVARRFAGAQDFLFIGRGMNYPIALEGALKLKEISYIHAEGYPSGEMKHGPIALIDERMPVVAICTRSPVYEKVITSVEEARVRDAKMIVIGNEGDEKITEIADETIFVPHVAEILSPIVNVVPLQLLAYFVARERGCDVDQPRNLAKSVTVE